MRTPEKVHRPGNPDKGIKPYDVWQARLRHADGTLKWKIFKSKKEAERAIRDHETKLEAGVDTSAGDMKFAALVAEWQLAKCGKSAKRAPSTLKGYEQDCKKLIDYFGDWKLKSIGDKHIDAFRESAIDASRERAQAKLTALRAKHERIARDKRGVRSRRILAALDEDAADLAEKIANTGPRSTQKAMTRLRSIMKFAMGRRYIQFDPSQHSDKPKIDDPECDVLTPQEVNALFAATPPEHRAAMMTFVYGGVRLGELLGIQWSNVEWAKGRIWIDTQLDGVTGTLRKTKTKAGRRFVELPPFVIKELKTLRLRTSGEQAFAFHSRRWRDQVYFPALRRAGIRRIRIHDLRHTCASILIAAGADVVAVSRHLGHAKPGITLNRYSHFFERRESGGLAARMEAFIAAETTGATTVGEVVVA